MGSFSIWELLIVLVIVVLLFGTKKLRNMGGDLGGAIRNFKQSMNTAEKDAEKLADKGGNNDTIDVTDNEKNHQS